jgi:hypothetical protein
LQQCFISLAQHVWQSNLGLLCLQDSHVGTAVLDLGAVLDPAALSYLELPLSFQKPKHAAAGGQARLVLSVKGWISSFGTLLADTKHIPGATARACLDRPMTILMLSVVDHLHCTIA